VNSLIRKWLPHSCRAHVGRTLLSVAFDLDVDLAHTKTDASRLPHSYAQKNAETIQTSCPGPRNLVIPKRERSETGGICSAVRSPAPTHARTVTMWDGHSCPSPLTLLLISSAPKMTFPVCLHPAASRKAETIPTMAAPLLPHNKNRNHPNSKAARVGISTVSNLRYDEQVTAGNVSNEEPYDTQSHPCCKKDPPNTDSG
jgi:hypothetical protein